MQKTNLHFFELVQSIDPPSIFGLPNKNSKVIVIPYQEGRETYGAAFSSISNKQVSHGTLSEYRTNPLEFSMKVDNSEILLVDNFLTIKGFFPQKQDFLKEAREITFALKRYLSFITKQPISINIVHLIANINNQGLNSEDVLRKKTIFNLQTYELNSLKENLTRLLELHYSKKDKKIDKAIAYFSHAITLKTVNENIEESYLFSLEDKETFSYQQIIVTSDIFLNFFKSITCIVGDPSIKKDGFQSTYKKFIPESDYQIIKSLKEIRDNFDVAHKRLDWEGIRNISENLNLAEHTANKTIKAYIEYLQQN